jgi:hypothetical protein
MKLEHFSWLKFESIVKVESPRPCKHFPCRDHHEAKHWLKREYAMRDMLHNKITHSHFTNDSLNRNIRTWKLCGIVRWATPQINFVKINSAQQIWSKNILINCRQKTKLLRYNRQNLELFVVLESPPPCKQVSCRDHHESKHCCTKKWKTTERGN